MEGKVKFLSAKEVADMAKISETSAYRLIKKLNEELEKKGSKRYFEEKTCI